MPFDRLVDPEGIASWPETMGRDGARTPMPWRSNEPNAGFSTAEPWLPLDPMHSPRAVDRQAGDPDSVLSFFLRVIRYRQASSPMVTGDLEFLRSPPDTLLFLRTSGEQRVLCGFNLSEKARVFEVEDLRGFSVDLAVGPSSVLSGDGRVTMGSWSGFVAAHQP